MTTTTFLPFELEHWQSDHEQTVRHNLADSSADSLVLGELVDEADRIRLFATPLHYPEVNGESRLRDAIARQYAPAALTSRDNVLVTVGAAQANAIIVETLCTPGCNVVVVEPGYRQVAGIAANLGAVVRTYHLDPEQGWSFDAEEIEQLVDADTAFIYVCNPNNPTGRLFDGGELSSLLEIAAVHGTVIVSDEVYQGSECAAREPAPTMWGLGDDVIVVNSLSKSYGLSGLRIGWMVADADRIDDLWRRHEYLVISTGRLDNELALIALEEPKRSELLHRNLAAIGRGWEEFESWAKRNRRVVAAHRPMSTGLAFVRYDIDIDSVALADAFRIEADVLVAPGSFFGLDGWFRLNFGFAPEVMRDALDRMTPVLKRLRNDRGPAPADLSGAATA